MNQAIAAYAAWLPAAGAHELFRDGPTTVAGATAMPRIRVMMNCSFRIYPPRWIVQDIRVQVGPRFEADRIFAEPPLTVGAICAPLHQQ